MLRVGFPFRGPESLRGGNPRKMALANLAVLVVSQKDWIERGGFKTVISWLPWFSWFPVFLQATPFPNCPLPALRYLEFSLGMRPQKPLPCQKSVPLPGIQSEIWLVHAKVREPHLSALVLLNFPGFSLLHTGKR